MPQAPAIARSELQIQESRARGASSYLDPQLPCLAARRDDLQTPGEVLLAPSMTVPGMGSTQAARPVEEKVCQFGYVESRTDSSEVSRSRENRSTLGKTNVISRARLRGETHDWIKTYLEASARETRCQRHTDSQSVTAP